MVRHASIHFVIVSNKRIGTITSIHVLLLLVPVGGRSPRHVDVPRKLGPYHFVADAFEPRCTVLEVTGVELR